MTTGTYLVSCPALNEQEIVHDIDHANDICFAMNYESGHYAYVEDWLGHTDIENGELD